MRQKLSSWTIVLLLSSILWLGFSQAAIAKDKLSPANQRHIVERLSFGATSGQLEQIKSRGIEAYIQSQLNPPSVTESSALNKYLATLSSIAQKPIELQKQYALNQKKIKDPQLPIKQKQKIRRKNRKINDKVKSEAVNAHLARAIYSNRQLQEVMVDFWFNHFSVSANKGATLFWINDYEDRIRTHALGNFRDLLGMTAKHPAMLIYLDNKKNIAPNSPAGKKNKSGLNENYARELMELHTLGVDGGYTQDDVIALARIFTGWGTDVLANKSTTGFFFYKKRHDRQEKVFLGQTIGPNGVKEGKRALDILARHPATAHFISYKLAQYFVADRPPTSLVDTLTQKFIESDGNIKQVMDVLIHSREFNDPQYYKQKFKTPYQYLVSLVRMAEIEQPNIKRIQGMLYQLSMPTYMASAPTGYKNTEDAWLNPQGMLQRTSLATAIAKGVLNRDYSIQPEKLSNNFGKLSPKTKQAIAKTRPKLRSALILGSPEAMYR